MLCAVEKVWGIGGKKASVTPGEHDDSTPAMWCEELGWMPGDGFVEYVGWMEQSGLPN
jgi:hypothetical protein